MTENLRLGSTEKQYVLTSADTNLPEGNTFTTPLATEFGSTVWETGTDEEPNAAIKINDTEGAMYGNLYNWYTAIGGKMVYGDGAASDQDICPLGWQLPNVEYNNTAKSAYTLYITAYKFTLGWPATISEDEFQKYMDVPLSRDQPGGYISPSGQNNLYGQTRTFWLNARGREYQHQSDQIKHAYVNYVNGVYRANPGGVLYPTNGTAIRCVAQ